MNSHDRRSPLRGLPWMVSAAIVIAIVGGAAAKLTAQSNSAQGSIAIPAEEAASHLIKRVEPVYPAFDKAVGIQGTVRVHVMIGTDGRVKVLFARSPHPSLYQAAQNAVAQYVWRPFEKDGRPVTVETDVSVTFELPKTVSAPPPPPYVSLYDFKGFSWGGAFSSSDFLEGQACPECLKSLPPELRNWIVERLKKQIQEMGGDSLAPSSEFPAVEADLADNILPPVIEVVQIAEKKDLGVKLYLYRAHLQELCGASGNCEIDLLKQDASGIHELAQAGGLGYYVCYNSRFLSDWPLVFFISHMSVSQTDVVGYGEAGGSWGRLYCGEINVSYEQTNDQSKATEIDDVRVCD